MSEQIVWAFIAGAALGGYLALALALHIMERRARRYKESALHLTVTPEVVSQINAKSQATDAALSRQVACTDGLGAAVPPAPTFDDPTQEILDSIPLGCGLPVYNV